MNKPSGKIWLPAVLALSLAGAVTGCNTTGNLKADTASAAQAPVRLMKLGAAMASGYGGKIAPDQEVKIVSKIAGKVSEVLAQEGAEVKKGDILIQLETSDLLQQVKQAESAVIAAQAKLDDARNGTRSQELQAAESALRAAEGGYEQAQAVVEQAKAGFDLATKTYNQLRNQYDSNSSVTKEVLEQGTLNYEKARTSYVQAQAAAKAAGAQEDAARSKLQLAREGATENTLKAMQAEVDRLTSVLELANSSLNNASITAPSDGMVVKRGIQPGEMAQPGTPLLSIVNMKQVQIELSVADTQIGQVKTGTPVQVKVPNVVDTVFNGTITFVSPVSNANSNTFPVKVTVDNKEGKLFGGMVAEVYTQDASAAKLEVPASAIIKKDGKEYVVRSDNKTARLVEVKTTEKGKDWVYAEAGAHLAAGQEIVVNPDPATSDGAALRTE
ncbi:efflux RND transporter periplasmic adaptor subunit [Paenibacillus silviterrae]|uniref:efflux RND transporter periplasmic adaptor subunit n=1 Tax=Paenibacillus silviterrae TaxID=3242194 RepID=UPI002543ABC2|nr:efflux RND transporter periplasmic adaptor subunit [Paenibacillus chinjuensis]